MARINITCKDCRFYQFLTDKRMYCKYHKGQFFNNENICEDIKKNLKDFLKYELPNTVNKE